MMKLSPGELVDKWSIVQMKGQVDPKTYVDLYQKLTREVCELILNFDDALSALMSAIGQLVGANSKIWLLEAGFRNGNGNEHSSVEDLVEIGKIAIQIREINRVRVKAREAIDNLTGHIPDKKYDHLSQDEQDQPKL